MATETPTPDDAPEDFWSEFGKFAAGKLNLFDDFMKSQNEAPSPEPVVEPVADTPAKPKKKGWFASE